MITYSGLCAYKRVASPLSLNLKLTASEDPLYSNPTFYRCIVGKLNFLTHTRLDLAFAVQYLSQFMQAPRVPQYEALQHTLKYVAATTSQGILIHAADHLTIQAFSYSNWA